MPTYALIAAAVPALLGSLLLLNFAEAPRALLVEQAAIALAALLASVISVRWLKTSSFLKPSPWLFLGMVVLLYLPLLDWQSSPPHRWLGLFGFRLYIAPVVLPVFLLLWHQALSTDKSTVSVSSVSALLAGLALFTQTDAAQLSALAIGSIPIFWCLAIGRAGRLCLITALLGAAAVSWSTPDPLDPVTYVEGVFLLAASASGWWLFAAVLVSALPIVILVWLARSTNSAGVLAVGLYFSVLLLLAPIQTTPVPLLGFGAGPVLGYFIMAAFTRCENETAG